jgi:hypothetical protein
MSGWIGVDLDGTLAEYHGWIPGGGIGKPIRAMVERVKKWLAEGKDVRIFTARVFAAEASGFEHGQHILAKIEDWCLEHLGVILPITCTKDMAMIELWDDRAVQVIPNTGKRADGLP